MKRILLLLATMLISCTLGVAKVIYVDHAAGGSNNGIDWTNAYLDLQDALSNAIAGDTIAVAGGRYIPHASDDEISFDLKSDVVMLGGFASGEVVDAPSIANRDFETNQTILSGDLNGDDVGFENRSDNTVQLVTGSFLGSNTVFDGFTIQGAQGGTFDYGAAMYLTSSSQLLMNNITIKENKAGDLVVIFKDNCDVEMHNSCIINNRGYDRHVFGFDKCDSVLIKNTTIARNYSFSSSSGDLIEVYDVSWCKFENTIMYQNFFEGDLIDEVFSDYFAITNSLIQGSGGSSNWSIAAATDLGGNLDTDPLFYNISKNDVRVFDTSHVLGAGTGGDNMGCYQGAGLPFPIGEVYVDASASGNNNGLSWTDAYTDLYNALIEEPAFTTIYIASGTYKPDAGSRYHSFQVKSGVKMYGGFKGTEVPIDQDTLDARNFEANTTILTGDLNGDDNGFANIGDNAYHVIEISYTGNKTLMDGFIITGGCANASNDQYKNGGGINAMYCDATFQNIALVNNFALSLGGGIYFYSSNPTILNATITNNQTSYYDYGGGVYARYTDPQFVNTILWDNIPSTEPYYSSSSNAIFRHCVIQGSGGSGAGWDSGLGSDAGYNYDSVPLVYNASQLDFRLLEGSSALNTGNTAYGNHIGYYQYALLPYPEPFYVKADATGNNDGSDWSNAFNDLQDALLNASPYHNIYVAAGNYVPHDSDRGVSFVIPNSVELYGGFSGAEALPIDQADMDNRDFAANPAILSGDLDSNDMGFDNNTENADNVVFIINCDSTTILDGFTIKGGNSIDKNEGGGIYMENSAAKLSNLLIYNNQADYYGGGIMADHCTGTITNCAVVNNLSNSKGGGLYSYYSNLTVDNATFSSNEADNGGAFYIYNEGLGINNSIIHGNIATTAQPEIYLYGSGTCNVYNCILEGFDPAQSWYGTDAGNNMDTIPLLYNPLKGDYRLLAGSPAIGNGDPGFGNNIGAWQEAGIPYPGPIYVDVNASGLNNGANWNDAYTSLQSALYEATPYHVIYVAKGAYYPSLTDETISFEIPKGVKLFGGFAGNESPIDQSVLDNRDFSSNPTVLSGDIDMNDSDKEINGTNSEQIVYAPDCDSSNVFDGFTIKGADGSNGMYASGDINLKNLIFYRNEHATIGGGLYLRLNNTELTSCVFYDNYANQKGGGLYLSNSTTTISNVTIVENSTASYSSSYHGGGIYINNSPGVRLVNVILTGNHSYSNYQIYQDGSTVSSEYCIIEGSDNWYAPMGTDLKNNYDTIPKYYDLFTGDVRLLEGSAGIDIGLDSVGDNIGYYQKAGVPYPDPIYVDRSATGGNNGSSWGHAFTNLQDALAVADIHQSIYVAQGTYTPSATGYRDTSFVMRDRIKLYGGFAGNEKHINLDSADNRDFEANETILSGDLNGDDAGFTGNAENSIHVVEATYLPAGVLIDGFTITGGNADAGQMGGGMYIEEATPILKNMVFTYNYADKGGAIYSNNTDRITVANALFYKNDAGTSPVYADRYSNSIYINTTFLDNSSSNGGIVRLDYHCDAEFFNTIMWHNKPAGDYIVSDGTTSNAYFGHCLLEGCEAPGDWNHSVYGLSLGNNVDADPMFIEELTGDIRLFVLSPALNTGDIVYGSNIGKYQGPGVVMPFVNSDTTLINFGDVFIGDTSAVLSFNVYGLFLSGDVTITSPGDVALSLDSNDFSGNTSVITLSPENDTVHNTMVYARYNPLLDNILRDTLIIYSNGAKDDEVVVEANVIRPPQIFVKPTATGLNNGISWDDAFTDLQDALAVASGGDSIFVAKGNYIPHATDSNAAFWMLPSVKVYGGFAGDEEINATTLAARDFDANETILNGDLAGDDSLWTNKDDNAFHVVFFHSDSVPGTIDTNTILDGFTITNGYAHGTGSYQTSGGGIICIKASPVIKNIKFIYNSAIRGGGMYVSGSARISHTVFRFNKAKGANNAGGGAIYMWKFAPRLTNSVFEYNSAEGWHDGLGGALHISGSYAYTIPYIDSVEFRSNYAFSDPGPGGQGGAIYIFSRGVSYLPGAAKPSILNALFCGNIAGGGKGNAIYALCGDTESFEANTGIIDCDIKNATFMNHTSIPIYHREDEGNSTMNFTNTILWDTAAAMESYNFNANTLFQYCIIYNSYPSGLWDDILGTDVANNSDADPILSDHANCDHRLDVTSPAIGAGNGTDGNNIGYYQDAGIFVKVPEVHVSKFDVYPNPFTDLLNIDAIYAKGVISYKLFTATGVLVMQGNIDGSGSINVSNLQEGVYLLRIISCNQQITYTLIK